MKNKLFSGIIGGALVIAAAGCGSSSAAPPTATTAPAGAATTTLYTWGHPAGGKKGGSSQLAHTTPMKVTGVQGTIVQVSTSNSDSYALTAAGDVYAWGDGAAGELGDGSTPTGSSTAVRVDFPSAVKIASLPDPMPFDGGMAIDTSGDAWGWGNDKGQQFCQPHKGNLSKPVKIPLTHVTAAVGALKHTTYDANGKIVGCGQGTNGQLGNGTTGNSATPTAVRGLPSGEVKALVASWGDAGALMSNGSFYDWGYNHRGQLGNGTEKLADTAVHVSLPAAVRQVSQGGSTKANGQTLAILTNGQVWEWGTGTDGQLGDGKTTSSSTPRRLTEPKGVTFVKVNSGGGTNFAIDSSGHLWAWGWNAKGQVGTGSAKTKQLTPVRVGAVTLDQVSSTASVVDGYAKT